MRMITDGLFQQAIRRPDHIALKIGEKCVTYKALKETIVSVSEQLLTLKKEKKQLRVGLLLENSETFLELFLGAAYIGGLAIPFDPKWKKSQLNEVLQFTKPDVLFSSASLLTKVDQEEVDGPILEASTWLLLKEGEDTPSSLERKQVTEWDDFYLGFTSGTTGLPKGFKRHHHSWTESFRVSNDLFKLGETDTIMAPGPFVHSLSLYAACHALAIGATFVLMDRFEASAVKHLIEKEQVTTLYVVPTMLEALLAQKGEAIPFPIRLISSGDKLHEETVKRVKVTWPSSFLYEFYGTSETSFISFLDYQDPGVKVTSVGKPFPNVQLRLGHEEEGDIGPLFVKSPMLFTSYDQNLEATQKVLKEGWYQTGDLAKIDEEGYLFLVGREKNRLISGGLNIYPEEIERELKAKLGVEKLAIIGLPDTYWGDKLILILEEGEALGKTDEDLLKKIKENLPAYQCPKEIRRLAHFPMTGSGKIARKQLTDHILSQVGAKS
jgi:long-chain acyl-CoA synthetase